MNTIPNTMLPRWNDQGLIPVITQDATSGDVLMLAWMNEEAMALTFAEGRAVYWSRSRAELWRKGDTSGHVQELVDARLDCDGDTLLLKVNQHGAACHTGRPNCFFYFRSEGQWLAEEGDHS
ncbi:MAG: phosphoribosyl-AMP cyclohydrolase [Luminiphilus sp.]|nr:phosphoribosyl-AMP cyclohydrolase [Luminiphilus sp.]